MVADLDRFIHPCINVFLSFRYMIFRPQQTFILLMEKLQNVVDESFFLADFVPLNLFMLDCRRLNKVIVNLINEIKHFVTDFFKALNQKENRRLVEHRFCIFALVCLVMMRVSYSVYAGAFDPADRTNRQK